jgi:hypothetical protein
MITAIDTNILLDILVPNEKFYEASATAIEDAASSGSLVICDLFANLTRNSLLTLVDNIRNRLNRIPRAASRAAVL